MKQMEKTYATMGPNVHNGMLDPRVTGTMPPANQRPAPDSMTSYPTQWTCATLAADGARTDPLIELSDEEEGLYNSLK